MKPGSMGAMTMADMVAALKGKTGDAMDGAFLETMIPHHAGGVAMARETLATGAHPELKRLCQHMQSASWGKLCLHSVSWLR